MPVHFRCTYAHKVLFCTFKFFCIFETLLDKKNSVYLSELSIKSTAKVTH
jgi:hypothetical protein